MKKIAFNFSLLNHARKQNSLLIHFIAIIFLALVSSCGLKEEKQDSYLEEALQKAPDAYFEKAFVGPQHDGTYIVATSQRIDPAGENITFSGRPVDLAIHADESVLAVKNINNIVFIKPETHEIIQTLALPKGGNTFTGIVWSDDGQKVWTTDTKGKLRAAQKSENGQYEWIVEMFYYRAPVKRMRMERIQEV